MISSLRNLLVYCLRNFLVCTALRSRRGFFHAKHIVCMDGYRETLDDLDDLRYDPRKL